MRTNESILEKALNYATTKHSGQQRKDNSQRPYIEHPLRVKELLTTVGGITDESTLAAALLHDILEDTKTTLQELENEFGAKISLIVAELTDDKSLEKAVRKELQIEIARTLSPEASAIRIGDKIANVEDVLFNPPLNWGIERRRGYVSWATRVIHSIAHPNKGLVECYNELCSRAELVLSTEEEA